jgi:EmrB/QacA subfamily drug resistance transporter
VTKENLVNTVGSEGAISSAIAPAAESPRDIAPPRRTGFAANLVPLAVASALFMEFIDSTALSTALPTLAKAFHSDPVHLKLALTSYLLALAVLAPASGWVADRFGGRRVFLSAMTVFLVGSALCGLSHSLPQLVGARIIQGMGGAMMTPVGRLIVVGAAPRDRLVSAMTWFTMPALVGPLIGPPLSGLVLGVASWPFIFYINIPVGLAGMAAVMAFVPKVAQPHPGRFDTWGFCLSAVAITAIVFLAETFGVNLTPWWLEAATFAVGLAAAIAFVRHALTAEHPVLDIRLFNLPTFSSSMIGGTLVRLGIGATPLLLPLLLQNGLGWSPMKSGSVSIAMAVGALSLKAGARRVISRFGFRNVLIVSALATTVVSTLPGFFRADTPILVILAALALGGFGRSLHFTAANVLTYADIPKDGISQASTLSTVIQQVGMSLGVSFGGLMLHLARGKGELTPQSFVMPFIMVGVAALLAVPFYWRLDANAGSEIGGKRKAPTPVLSSGTAR